MQYTVQAVSRSGQIVNNSIIADSVDDIRERLLEDGYEMITADVDWRATIRSVFERKQIRRKVIVEFFHHLKGLLELGLNITAALSTVKESIDDQTLFRALTEIEDLVTKGYSLSQAMRQTGAFPGLAVASIAAAERTNRLEEVFEELGNHFKNIESLVGDAKKAATYPLIALMVLAAVMSLMLFFVVPQLKTILPADPPLPTRILLFMSDSIAYVWWVPFTFPILYVAAVKGLTLEQKATVMEKLYSVPLVGRIALNLELSTVFMNLAMLNGGGIPLLEALRIAAEGSSSPFIADKLLTCHNLAKQGGSLSEGFADKRFPRVVSRAITHGEATGRFDKQFAGLSKFLRDRTAGQIAFLSTFIEPALLVVGGGMMLMMAMAIFMPIYGQIQNVR
ncbi:MAG: type II secretion system F family protein [Myxococcota bacterium]